MEEKCKNEKELKCCRGIDWIDILILSELMLVVLLLLHFLKIIINEFLWLIILLGIVFVFSFVQIFRYCGFKWKKCCDKPPKMI